MSQENVEVIRSLYEGWLRGDMGLDRLDPEISMEESSVLPGPVSVRGIGPVTRYIESFSKHWAEVRFEPEEFIDAGDSVVVVALVGKGKRSGIEVTHRWAYVWTVRGDKVLSMVGYADRAEALKGAGLEK